MSAASVSVHHGEYHVDGANRAPRHLEIAADPSLPLCRALAAKQRQIDNLDEQSVRDARELATAKQQCERIRRRIAMLENRLARRNQLAFVLESQRDTLMHAEARHTSAWPKAQDARSGFHSPRLQSEPTAMVPLSAASATTVATTETAAAKRIRIRLDGQSPSNFYTELGGDVAQGGVFIATCHTLAVGTSVRAEIEMQGYSKPVLCAARVAWVDTPPEETDANRDTTTGMGLRFVAVHDSDLARVRLFSQSRKPLCRPANEDQTRAH